MFVILTLILIALFVLFMGFLGIKIPFITIKKKPLQKKVSQPEQQQLLKDRLVKKAIDITPGSSLFLKRRNKRYIDSDQI